MDYSAANTGLWNLIIQLGFIACAIIAANVLRRKVPFMKKVLLPVSVMAGFILLILKTVGLYRPAMETLEMLVYHSIALGFIAMSLRTAVPETDKEAKAIGFKSGAIIVGTYLIQAVLGLVITLALAYTVMPDMFKAAGLLLPMGYGQGPGQANNIGGSYESMGFAGGRSFGLSIAAAGYLCAYTVGVVILNRWKKSGMLKTSKPEDYDETKIPGFFQDSNEIPIADSIDKFSMQAVMVLIVYLFTFLITWGLTSALSAISSALAGLLNSLLWGFNFIIGSVLAMVVRVGLAKGQKAGLVTRQYQNNYLLNRISGFFFDLMIVAGIASIDLGDISGLWLPFLLMSVAGAIATWYYLVVVCKRAYGSYYREGLISMYGMLTGTIGSGILLLREIDPELGTPAANNLVVGSSYAIVLGAPLLVFVSLAAKSTLMCFVTLGLAAAYLIVLTFVLMHQKKKK